MNIYWPDIISNNELKNKTGKEPVQEQLRTRKWNWFGHTLRSDDSTDKQALRWTTQQHLEREFGEEMWTAGFRYSWRKMEVAVQDRAECRRVVCGLCSTGSDNM